VTGPDPIDEVLQRLQGVRKQGGYWKAKCPAHEDRNPSLSVARGTEQPVILKCQAGCTSDDIIAAIGLDWQSLCTPQDSQQPKAGTVIAEYRYFDESSTLLFVKERRFPKDFRVKCPDGRGGWTWQLGKTRRVLYNLPQVAEAIRGGQMIYVTEGEKDADAVTRAGAVATCNFDGAAKAGQRTKVRAEYAGMLAGASSVVVIADDDEPGLAHAREWARLLAGQVSSVRIVKAAEGKDVYDHLVTHRRQLDELVPVPDEPVVPAASGSPAEATADQWEDPLPFTGQAAPLPEFPVNALPAWMADMVQVVARFFDTPPDVAAFAMLGAVSVATARRAWINARGQREPVNLYLLTALDSGSRKSGPFKLMAIDPLTAAQQRLQEEAEARPLPKGLDDTPVIRLFTTSATPAGLRDLAARPHHGMDGKPTQRIGVISDEGGIFQELAGRYSGQVPDLDLVLSGWNGSPYTADRATKVVLPMNEPVLTMSLTVQPHVLKKAAGEESFVARGLLARFLYGLPPDVVGHRGNQRTPVPERVAALYLKNMVDLQISYADYGRYEWSLSDDAYKIFHDAEQVLEPKLARGALYGGNDGMREWASKYTGQLLRIAGILHAAGHPNGGVPNRISESTMQNALTLGEYFLAHAEATFGFMRADPNAEGAGEILRWLADIDWTAQPFAGRGPRHVTKREVSKFVWRYRNDPDGALMALRLLEKHGWVTITYGVRQSVQVGVHPKTSALLGTTKNPGVFAAQDTRGTAENGLGTSSAGLGTTTDLPRTAEEPPRPFSAHQHPYSPAETSPNRRSAESAEDFSGTPSAETHATTESDDTSWVQDAPVGLDDAIEPTFGDWPDESPGAAANPCPVRHCPKPGNPAWGGYCRTHRPKEYRNKKGSGR